MKEFDPQREARVWQRVKDQTHEKPAPQQNDNLPMLIMEQLQLTAAYMQLARQMPGKEGAIFVRLAREAKAQAVCLKGILILMTGQNSDTGVSQPQISPTDVMLRRCYGKELRLLKTYESRRLDPEYGPVFERMAARGRDHCCTLLELIGGFGKK